MHLQNLEDENSYKLTSVDGRSTHKEINRICMWLSDRVKLKGKWKLFAWGVFSNNRASSLGFEEASFLFFRIRSAAAGTKVSTEGSLGRTLKPWIDFGAPTSRDPNLWLLLHNIFEICWDFLQGARISLFHVY